MTLEKLLKLSLWIMCVVCVSCQNERKVENIDVELIEVHALADGEENVMSVYIDGFKSAKDTLMNVVIGYTDYEMSVAQPEGLLNNLVADMMLTYANQVKETQFALSNNGGIRRTLFAGEITMGDIYEILPFDNTLVLMEFTGRQVQEIADVIAEKGGAATSGISFKIVDHKAVDVKVAGEPLDLDKMYWMVTNDYLSYGNDYYLPLIYAQDKEMLNVNLRDMAMDYIKSESEKGHKIESSLKKEVYYEK